MGALANLRRGIWASKQAAPAPPFISVIVGDDRWFRSTSLTSWIPITKPFANGTTCVGYIPAFNRFVCASYATNTSAYSDDGGENWTLAPIGVAVNAMFFCEATAELFAFGNATVRKSTDGITWSTLALPAGVWNECTIDTATGELFALATSGAVIHSTDDGATWPSLTAIGGTGSAQGILSIPGTDILVASRRSTGGIRRSVDRGVTWGAILAGDYNRSKRSLSTGTIITTPQGAAVPARKSTDDGVSFPTTIPDLTGSWPGLQYVPSLDAFFALPFGSIPHISVDDGLNFDPIPVTSGTDRCYNMAWVP